VGTAAVYSRQHVSNQKQVNINSDEHSVQSRGICIQTMKAVPGSGA
jgi:hypothetical protein